MSRLYFESGTSSKNNANCTFINTYRQCSNTRYSINLPRMFFQILGLVKFNVKAIVEGS